MEVQKYPNPMGQRYFLKFFPANILQINFIGLISASVYIGYESRYKWFINNLKL
nr:MAG TPA: hypothetical protein [Caudoviricetes sp.]